ncbi:MAG: SufE family protein [Pseudomonadota bacterium]
MMSPIEEIVENFSFLDDWEDRYRYLIELGRELKPLPEEQHSAENKVQGCVSQVWVWSRPESGDDPIIHFLGDSDAHIVRGLVAVTLAVFSGKRASEIGATDEISIFKQIGLEEHLTPQRSNGLKSMVGRIKQHAAEALAA